MENQKVKISGIENLVIKDVRYNKKTVSVPIDTWGFILQVLAKVKLEVNTEK